jgi:demethylmenaquinone methyltransferase/2-methoxy-6-polyprenyl-1,4-benzoquinol methylase
MRLRLPFPDGHFNLVTSAFGFRNLADYDAGLREIARVLAPGGECGILDFGEPGGLIGHGYRIYFKKVLPAIGTMISGVRGPYAYLPASVERFPAPDEMLGRMRQAGFREASWTPYTFGIAGLYRGGRAFNRRDAEILQRLEQLWGTGIWQGIQDCFSGSFSAYSASRR